MRTTYVKAQYAALRPKCPLSPISNNQPLWRILIIKWSKNFRLHKPVTFLALDTVISYNWPLESQSYNICLWPSKSIKETMQTKRTRLLWIYLLKGFVMLVTTFQYKLPLLFHWDGWSVWWKERTRTRVMTRQA